jgi:hypothetical protein
MSTAKDERRLAELGAMLGATVLSVSRLPETVNRRPVDRRWSRAFVVRLDPDKRRVILPKWPSEPGYAEVLAQQLPDHQVVTEDDRQRLGQALARCHGISMRRHRGYVAEWEAEADLWATEEDLCA